MKVDLQGRVRNTNLPVSRSLLPLFDAIINSIHAIEDRGSAGGKISVKIQRDRLLIDGESEEQLPDIVGFEISDNGIGFDADNYSSFDTSDSTWKQDRGAKGVGRFLWLKAFGEAYVESVFAANSGSKKRKFHFKLPNGISGHSSITVDENELIATKVSLRNFLESYRRNCPRRMEAIADQVIDHCFVRLLKSDCPAILITDEAGGSFSLNERFRKRVHDAGRPKTITVNGCALSIRHFHILEPSGEHRIVYCAHEREVLSEKPESPDLAKRLRNDDGESFVVNTCVSGEVLDRSVNQERTGFNLQVVDSDLLPGALSLEQLKNATNQEVVEHLKPQLDEVREAKLREYRKHIEQEAPQYRLLLRREEELMNLPPGLAADKLDLELHKIKSKIEIETKKKVSTLVKDVTTFDEYRKKYTELLEQVNDLGKAALTEHVVHRKLVLDILSKQLAFHQETERYVLEEHIHKIIFPLRSDSDEVPFEQQNLWIIDEKLTFHRYLASDTRLDKQETHESADRQRPDLVIWNNAFSLSEEHSIASLNSVTIIEFKQPGKEDYSEVKNPVAQVYDYVDRIKAGKAKSHAGRVLTVRENTPFYGYVLCDLFPHLRKLIENYGLTPTPDGSGYFGYNPNRKCYLEVISYEKMLEDARKRNRSFFEKLQLL